MVYALKMAFRGVKVVVVFEKCVPAPNHSPFDRVRGANHYTISPSLFHFMKILNYKLSHKLASDSRGKLRGNYISLHYKACDKGDKGAYKPVKGVLMTSACTETSDIYENEIGNHPVKALVLLIAIS